MILNNFVYESTVEVLEKNDNGEHERCYKIQYNKKYKSNH